mgnify:CR=1 FL=1|tara:strand:+ start:1603 stop:2331 length:729 start_codon:yes stop_codon:yes gene_type:complete
MKILRVKDPSDSFHKPMPVFDLPFKVLINGKSQLSGKTTIILNLLLNPDFKYDKQFKGENMYIVSDNKLDNKLKLLADYKEIPQENIMNYDESVLTELYDDIEDKFLEEKEEKNIQNRVILFDDCGYSGNLKNKQSGIISKLICNGRHLNLSQIYSSQKYSQCSTTLRTNITGAILFNTSAKELDLISQDFNYLKSSKAFVNMFRDITGNTPRDFLVVNFTNKDSLFMDSEFESIDTKKYDN